MGSIRRFYDHLLIKNKLILVLLIALAVSGIACVVGIQIVTRSNQVLLYNTLASSLSYSAKELRDSLQFMEAITFNLATDQLVQEHLAALQERPEDVLVRGSAFRQLNTTLLNYSSRDNAVHFIALDSDTMNLYTDAVRAEKLPAELRNAIRRQAEEADGRAVWMCHDGDRGNTLSVARSVRRISPHLLDRLGVVTLNVRVDCLVESSTSFSDRFGEAYYMLSVDGEPVFQSASFPEGLMEHLAVLEHGEYGIIHDGAHRYFAVMGVVPDYGWTYVNLILYDDMHNAVVRSGLLYFVVILLGVTFAIVFCQRMVKHLTEHISALTWKMREFSKNNATLPALSGNYSDRRDELGMLHRQFDKMAGEIINLIQNDYTNQLLMKDAQLKALEAQIDPHFLYNVLQSISWNAKELGDRQIPAMVDALGKMLRTTLSREDEEFTIGKEAEFVGNYMIIQQSRFEGQLQFSMTIPEEIRDVRIPKLTIQPLVENAIRYAMEDDEEVCRIQVVGEVRKDKIIISVRNTGSAFDADLLENLENQTIKPNGFGIGILNIHHRLRLFGGDRYCLELLNEDNMAVARIKLPYALPEKEDLNAPHADC